MAPARNAFSHAAVETFTDNLWQQPHLIPDPFGGPSGQMT